MAERRLPIYPPDTRCEKCGHPYGEHHYRHPFVTSAQPVDPWDRIAALEAKVERLRRERAELQSSGLALFRYAQDISHRIKRHKLIDIFPLPQKELESWVKVLAKGDARLGKEESDG